ncbi:MAG: bifunctional (p)ppGpp synthetase/guanosine-3',5'-bis(diphosphate) 3'-pyrophosphohydrolase, partial [Desulfuromonadales bacterium]|nr:bifunctional (p)ppGpp synthetase/guanosine-3',5'-bis(diphosphate) 3'-pyrophosphohydrolase [Desulfuromonadales bacterium]
AVRRAYDFVSDLHDGKKRLTGEPYLSHPAEIAYILAQLRMDVNTIVAGLLHDVVEDSLLSLETVQDTFGPDV